jgi:uncharacterized protein involved in exopolysaccharide biosynthesis
MTTPRQSSDLDAEREVDLARWRAAVVRRWWVLLVGLIVGAVIGLLLSFSGGHTYKAAALISMGQPLSPSGGNIQSFATNPRSVLEIVQAASVQQQAEQKAGMRDGALEGRVAVDVVGTTPGTTEARSSTLISLSVQGPNADKDALAANALADTVVTRTTAAYVNTKIATYKTQLATANRQLKSIDVLVANLNAALKQTQLAPINQLVLVSQLDNAISRQGNLYNQQATLDEQLAFAKEVESAKVITPARSVKTVARTRSTSVVVGAVIGLIVGAILAIVGDGRRAARAA